MNKTKKIISLFIIIALAFVILFVYLYSFNEAKKLARDQAAANKIQVELEIARQKLETENQKLRELRINSAWGKMSEAQYLKTKKLVAELDIFFKNPDSSHPEIQLRTDNKIIAEEINSRRLKITEVLKIWADNNKNSLETEQKFIEEIKTALLFIKAYLEEIKSIVTDLHPDSELTAGQINSYTNIINTSINNFKEVVEVITRFEIETNDNSNNQINNEALEIKEQIEIITEIKNTINDLENKLITPVATTTSTTPNVNVNIIDPASTTIKVPSKPRIVNPEPTIIYQYKNTPYRDNGVDVNYNNNLAPTQDW
jgi:hypothetical protein